MTLARMRSRDAVLEALAEYDRMGRDGFLHAHGYGTAHPLRAQIPGSGSTTRRRISASPNGIEFPDESWSPLAGRPVPG